MRGGGEHLATQGLGLHNDLQNEHSVVGNFPFIVMLRDFGTHEQKEKFIRGSLARKIRRSAALSKRSTRFDPSNPPPLCNLYVTMLQRLGVRADQFGSSTGTLSGLEMIG